MRRVTDDHCGPLPAFVFACWVNRNSAPEPFWIRIRADLLMKLENGSRVTQSLLGVLSLTHNLLWRLTIQKINMGQALWMDIAVWQSNSLYHVEKQGWVKTINLTSEAMRHQTSVTPQPIEKKKLNINRDGLIYILISECARKPLNILWYFEYDSNLTWFMCTAC